jgi:hypothetical protein
MFRKGYSLHMTSRKSRGLRRQRSTGSKKKT